MLSAHSCIPADNMGYRLNIFLFLHENICCGYSLEVPQRGTSNEYPQHICLLWRNKKNILFFFFLLVEKRCHIWSYALVIIIRRLSKLTFCKM